jgi:PAS domain S-box-containing protein
MRVKQKIRLGLGFVFIVVLFFGTISIFFISRLSNSSKIILKNNYETLSFTHGMRTVLDENKLPLSNDAKAAFNSALIKQEHNITEKGEYQATAQVRKDFGLLQAAGTPLTVQESTVHDIRVYLGNIDGLNMNSIVQKTTAAEASVDKAVLILGIICCFTFLILFSFAVNVSSVIAEPLRRLDEGLDALANQNYDYRISFDNDKEFEELSGAFNDFAAKLQVHENANLSELMAGKQRLEAIIERSQDAIMVTDEKQHVVFINSTAKNLFKLKEEKVTGKTISQLTEGRHNHLQPVVNSKHDEGSFKFEVDGKETLFRMESEEIFVPNLKPLDLTEVSIARLSAGRVYVLHNIGEVHAV